MKYISNIRINRTTNINNLAYPFADDTKLFSQITREEDAISLQHDLDALQTWSTNWLLNFHPDKCKLLTIGSRRINSSYHLTSREQVYDLECVSDMKDLGVTIDSNLNFESHIQMKVNKANQTMGMIRRAFTHLDNDTFLCLYKALVRPQLEYANAAWSPHKVKDITTIENVQRRATKQIPGLRELSYEERLKQLKLPTLVYRRARGDMIETYKILSDYNEEVSPLFNINKSSTRGNALKLLKPRAKRDVRKFSFTNRIVDLWNQLPNEVVNAKNLITFESRLDKFWAGYAFKYDIKARLPCHAHKF